MKLKNKKGFTIVELVIVIAVIAILAAVLIPTFSSLIEKANESKAMQAAKNEYTNYLTYDVTAGSKSFLIIVDEKYAFVVDNGTFDTTANTLKDSKVALKYGETTYNLTVTGKTIAIDGYTMDTAPTGATNGAWVVKYSEGAVFSATTYHQIHATQYVAYEAIKTSDSIEIFELAFLANA